MLDFFKNYSKYKQMEIDNAKNQTKPKLTIKEKFIYGIMIILCIVGIFINPSSDNILLGHFDLVILALLCIIYVVMRFKKENKKEK